MARISIDLPATFNFTATIPVRITDLNYGGHVGNDSILSLIHEAREQFFRSLGYSEKDLGGVGTIMSDVVINFKNELFYGDVISCGVAVKDVSRVSFDVVYVLKKNGVVVAEAKKGMVCIHYSTKKVASIPMEVRQIFEK
jgi:YbgC/YbaW family acyl-CoA thioester hydrolase